MPDGMVPSDAGLRSATERVAALARAGAEEVDRAGRFPEAAVAAMRDEGLLAAMVPRELGGAGLPPSRIAAIAGALGRACSSSGMVFAMHQSQVACLVAHGRDAPWHREMLRRLATDGLLIASVTSEAGIGGNIRNSLCAVTPAEGGRLRVEKQATSVSYGRFADVLMLTARRDADAAATDQVLLVLLRADARLERRGEWDSMGMRGTMTEPFSVSAELAPEQVLPAPFGEIAADTMVPASHLFWAGLWIGIASDAIDRARQFVRRGQRDGGGDELPPGAQRLVAPVEHLRSLQARVERALGRFDDAFGRPEAGASVDEAADVGGIKVAVSEGCLDAVREAMMVCGFAGYANHGPFSVARHLRDLQSAPLMVNNDRVRTGLARTLLARSPRLGVGG